MGTRADFYVGRGEEAGWLGSIAWDGDSIDQAVLRATTEREYRDAVKAFLQPRDDSTFPEQGWPWPWRDSRTTDYAYAFVDGKVYASCYGHAWYDPLDPPEDEIAGEKVAVFPDMTAIQKVDLGERSGVMFFGVPGVQSDEPRPDRPAGANQMEGATDGS